MLTIKIHEAACRGCQLCVDICPTDVFKFDTELSKSTVRFESECIACLSCAYLCPSGAIEHAGHHVVKNFYRDLKFNERMERFL